MRGVVRSTGLLFVVIVAYMATACNTASAPDTDSDSGQGRMIAITLRGQIGITTERVEGQDECVGSGAYSDVRDGMPVVVSDESGETVATDQLGRGLPEPDGSCRFYVTVSGLPDADSYAVQLGDRSAMSADLDEFEGNVWSVDLPLEDLE